MKTLKILGVAVLGGIFMWTIDMIFHVDFAKNVGLIARFAHDVGWAMMGAILYVVVSTKEKKGELKCRTTEEFLKHNSSPNTDIGPQPGLPPSFLQPLPPGYCHEDIDFWPFLRRTSSLLKESL